MLFESERVHFEIMSIDILEEFHDWRNTFEVMKSTSPFLELYTFTESQDFVMNVMLNAKDSKNYVIIDKVSRHPIGFTSLINIDFKNRNADCIIEIGEVSFWGKGYGTEALNLILKYAFEEMNLHRIGLKVFSFNIQAINLYNKLGFKKEGTLRESLFRNGKWHDIIQMGILQQEYLNERNAPL